MNKVDQILSEVAHEIMCAVQAHPPINTRHEAIAVIREEYLEAEQECFKGSKVWDKTCLRVELEQLAAMCIRSIVDLDL